MDEDVAEVEARLARALLPLTSYQRVGSALLPPPAYVRRHFVEHAAAGGVLDDRVLSETFLPFVDAARLGPGGTVPPSFDLLPTPEPLPERTLGGQDRQPSSAPVSSTT